MSLTEEDLLLVLELFAASDWEDLDLVSGDVRVAVSKRGNGPVASLSRNDVATASSATAPASAAVSPVPVTTPGPVTTPAPAGAPPDDVPPSGIVAVRSPTLGTFYVAGKPGAPPFVQPGDTVGPDDTLGIVEVMKLMNSVKAGIHGEVVKVCARNSELVEYDRVLFWLRPSGGEA
jgi:acetyl-CoA carboxylase biotin carboxyl carrier protein